MLMANWIWGVLASVLGACLDNLGVTLQKASHIAHENDVMRRAYWKEPRWLIGFFVFLAGNILNAVGLGLAPQTLFAAIGGVTLVANTFNSRLLLGEPLSPRVLVGTFVIILGSVLAVVFSSHPREDFDVEDLESFFTLKFLVFAGTELAVILALYLSIRAQQTAVERIEAKLLSRVDVDAGTAGGASDEVVNRHPQGSTLSPLAAQEGSGGAATYVSPSHSAKGTFPPPSLSPSRSKTAASGRGTAPASTGGGGGGTYAAAPGGGLPVVVGGGGGAGEVTWPTGGGFGVPYLARSRSGDQLVDSPTAGGSPRLSVRSVAQSLDEATVQEVAASSPASVQELESRRKFLSFSVPALAGVIGSFTVLSAKCVSELFRRTVEGEDQFDRPLTYAFVAALALAGFSQVHWLNMGLRSYNQLVVVPSFLSVYTLCSVLGGIFFFDESKGFTVTETVMFPVGTLISFVGVWLIASRPDQLSERLGSGLLVKRHGGVSVLSSTLNLYRASSAPQSAAGGHSPEPSEHSGDGGTEDGGDLEFDSESDVDGGARVNKIVVE